MKICLLLSRIANGGLERVQINLANQFLHAGHQVELVTGIAKERYYPSLSDVVPIVEIAREGAWQFPWGLSKYMQRAKPDCILTTSNDIACIALLLRPFLSPRTRIVVTQHLSLAAPLAQAVGAARAKRIFIYWMMRLLLPYADARVAVSQGVASDMIKTLGLARSSIDVIYNPIIVPDYADKRAEIISWPWPQDGLPTIIYAGRLAVEKRLDVLLAAVLPILRSGQARLMVLGDGPQSDWMKQQIDGLELQSVATCAGFVQNVLPYIARSDVLVLPSDYEGFGNVLVEAMYCGVQVISTDCPYGPREILADGQFGQLIPVGESSLLEAAIIKSIQRVFYIDRQKLIDRSKDFSAEMATVSYLKLIGTRGSSN